MCFTKFFDKHSDKRNPQSDSGHVIKSLSAKHNLKDFAHNFTEFLKAEYSEKGSRYLSIHVPTVH